MIRIKLPNVLSHGEEGHAEPMLGTLIGGAGAIALAIGAANDTGWLAIAGGVVLAIGLTATLMLNHMTIEYGIFKRLDDLDSK